MWTQSGHKYIKSPNTSAKKKKRLKRKCQDVSSGWHWKMDGLVAQLRNINHVVFNNNNSDNGINGLPLLENSGVDLASDTVGLRYLKDVVRTPFLSFFTLRFRSQTGWHRSFQDYIFYSSPSWYPPIRKSSSFSQRFQPKSWHYQIGSSWVTLSPLNNLRGQVTGSFWGVSLPRELEIQPDLFQSHRKDMGVGGFPKENQAVAIRKYGVDGYCTVENNIYLPQWVLLFFCTYL